jgi:hypothetical protein
VTLEAVKLEPADPTRCRCGWRVPVKVLIVRKSENSEDDLEESMLDHYVLYDCPECGQGHYCELRVKPEVVEQ